MTTIQDKITTVAQSSDLQVIDVIIKGFEYYDGYYGRMCKLQMILNYKEYLTLHEDFKAFYDTCELQCGRFSVNELHSLRRSLILLRQHIENSGIKLNSIIMNFLDNSIQNLDSWLNEVINVMVTEIS